MNSASPALRDPRDGPPAAAAMFLALIPSFLYVASGMTTKFSSISGYFPGS